MSENNTEDHIILSIEEQMAIEQLEDLNSPLGDGLLVGLKNRLHPDQIEQLKPMYMEGKKDLFLSCGRKWGKTELIGYVLWKHALENPGSACYYVAPENSHARELMWNNNRMQRFLGKASGKYIQRITNDNMIIWFKNGSYIRLIGSDNYMVANGLTPHIAVYDEFKGFNPRWHTEFAPNRAAKAAPIIIIGTKPRAGNKNMDQYNEILEYMRNDSKSYVADRTTFDNPINHLPAQKEIIDREIAQLRERGDSDVVELEYYSRVVPGGKKAIFPMLRKERHIFAHNDIIREIKKDMKRMEWYCIADPGSTTCFATLFACIHPYTRKVYLLDELYETNQEGTSTRKMYPQMDDKMMEFYPNSDVSDDWVKGFDEAAVWFATEVMDQYGTYFMPTQKHLNKKEHGLSLIKDLLLHDLLIMSDRLTNLFTEMEKYAKDERGQIPKKHDHLIDCLRYLLGISNYNMVEVLQRRKQDNDDLRGRFRRKEDEEENDMENWEKNLWF